MVKHPAAEFDVFDERLVSIVTPVLSIQQQGAAFLLRRIT